MTVITTVAADGWQATSAAPVDLDFTPITVSRQGFDATGATATITDTLYTTKRVRQAYPNQASLTSDKVALSDYVYATDTISGVTNNSAETSPKPIANWTMPDRKVVGNALTLSLVAFHRNGRAGKPVACVVFRATDGTTTVTATATTLTATVDPLTGNRVLEYVATLDITTLTDNGTITVNAKVYPWIGAAGSVIDSADLANSWQFSPRTFRKNTALAAAPNLIYVKATGNDSTGVVSTNAATAEATPCLTLVGAINRARALLGTGAGSLDGLRVRLDAGTWTRTTTPTANTVNAAIVIEPIPGVAKAGCILQFGSANTGFGCTYAHVRGLTVQRTGAFYLHANAGQQAIIEDCIWDWNGNTGQLGTNAAIHDWINVAFSAVSSATALANTTGVIHRMIRGCTGGAANSTAELEMITFVGNALTGGRLNTSASRAQDGVIVAFNKFISVGNGTSSPVSVAVGTAIVGFAVVQNVFEYTSASSQRNLLASGDSATPSVSHLVCWHNTFAGFNDYGRGNILYDETTGTARTHKLQSFVGNIHVQINTKSDIFKTDGTKLGNWAYDNGVGCRSEFARYRNAAGNLTSGFNQTYPGIASSISSTNTSPGVDPLFTSYQATTSGPTAGAGGGDYTIGALSPAKALVADSPLAVDLAGTARAATDNAGAYAHGATTVDHAATGILVGPGSTMAGSAARTRVHPTTGTLVGQGSTMAGSAARTRVHPTTGTLVGPGSTMAGSAARTRVHPTTGVLAAGNGALTGSAVRSLGPLAHATAGALIAGGTTIAASAARTRAHPTTGVLAGPGAVITSSAARTRAHSAAGGLVGPGALITGTSGRIRVYTAAGSLVGAGSSVTGLAALARSHGTTGAISGGMAHMIGFAARVAAEGLTVRPDRIIPGRVRVRIIYGVSQ